nr:reverse transcriptase domain-containing protein [Tanacetum cinerariifolium]
RVRLVFLSGTKGAFVCSSAPGVIQETSTEHVVIMVKRVEEIKLKVKEYQKKDKIRSKPDKNGKRGEAEKSQKQLQSVKEYQKKDKIRSKPDKNGKRGEAEKSQKQLQGSQGSGRGSQGGGRDGQESDLGSQGSSRAQVGNHINNQENNKNQDDNVVNDNNQGNVRTMKNDRGGCSYKEFMACNPKDYDGKGGTIVYTRWIKKMESVQDMSGCGENQKVKYTTGSFIAKALTWWNFQVQTRGREAAVGMTWEDFKTLTREEFCPNNEMQKLETKFWCHAMVGAGHGAYTDRFHKLARLVPHLVIPENKRIEREPSRDENVRGYNKRSSIGRAFSTITNPVRREYTGAAPKCTNYNYHHQPEVPCRLYTNYNRFGHIAKDCRVGPRVVNILNARNLIAARGSCFECGGTDHYKEACPRHKAEIVCHEKVVRIPLPNGETLRVLEERPEEKVRHSTSAKVKEQKLKDIVVVRNFSKRPLKWRSYQVNSEKSRTRVSFDQVYHRREHRGIYRLDELSMYALNNFVIVFIDDILIYSRTKEEHEMDLGDYDCENRYYPDKANVVDDALSRNERFKSRRVRSINMTIQSCIKDKILAAHNEASKAVNAPAKMLTKSAYFLPIREEFKMDRLAILYLNEIVARHGVPISIISDRDSRFTSRGSWDIHFLLVEFSYNNSYNSSVRYASFEALYGRKCHSPILWAEVGEGKLIRPEIVQETTRKISQINNRLKNARDRQKSYADKRRKPMNSV